MDFQQIEQRLAELLSRRFLKSMTKEDEKELQELMIIPGVKEYADKVDNTYINDQLKLRNSVDVSEGWQQIRNRFDYFPKKLRMNFWKRLAIAASFIAVFICCAYLFSHVGREIKAVDELSLKIEEDIKPSTGAVKLTLSNGDQLDLTNNSAIKNGIKEGSSNVRNENEQLVYSALHAAGSSEVFNTLSTPKGVNYKLVLADGTRVWLNSNSSIRFPTAFTGEKRNVSIDGEVYFEVAKSKTKPFVVEVRDVSIKVLGTQFNISAYSNNPSINTTLVEGSINVQSRNNSKLIRPGQQAQVGNENFNVVSNIEIDEVLAWQKNEFDFRLRTVPEIMRQLQQFYDFDIQYDGKISNDKFIARFNRDAPLSRILEILQQTGRVDFKISAGKVVVKFL